MMTEREEFKAWMALNVDRFISEGYDPREIAYFARMNDFSDMLIFEELSHFKTALAGGNFDDKTKYRVHLELLELKKHCGDKDLQGQWNALNAYLYFGTEFDH